MGMFGDIVKGTLNSTGLGGLGAAGASALGNILGSSTQSALGMYMSKKMAKYNYDLQKKGYREFPTAQVQGLEAAGINPMVAYGGIAGATAHAQNYQPAPNSSLGSDAVSSAMKYKERSQQDKIIDLQAKQLESTIKVNDSVAAKNAAEANAIGIQASAAERTSLANERNSMSNQRTSLASERSAKSGEWMIYDNKSLNEAGVTAYIDVKGKYQRVHTIRINKVTGEAYTIDGKRVDKIIYNSVPYSAKQIDLTSPLIKPFTDMTTMPKPKKEFNVSDGLWDVIHRKK